MGLVMVWPLICVGPDGSPIDALTWGALKEDPSSRIGRARVHHALVCTDYVGSVDCIFETQLFATRDRDAHTRWHAAVLDRYDTLEEARAGHIAYTQAIRSRGLGAVGMSYATSRRIARLVAMLSSR